MSVRAVTARPPSTVCSGSSVLGPQEQRCLLSPQNGHRSGVTLHLWDITSPCKEGNTWHPRVLCPEIHTVLGLLGAHDRTVGEASGPLQKAGKRRPRFPEGRAAPPAHLPLSLRSLLAHRRGRGRCDWQEAAQGTVTDPPSQLQRGLGTRPGGGTDLSTLCASPRCSLPLGPEATLHHGQNLPSFSLQPEANTHSASQTQEAQAVVLTLAAQGPA